MKDDTIVNILLKIKHKEFKMLKRAKLNYSAKLGEDLTWESYILAKCQ